VSDGSASTINHAILLLEQIMAHAARDNDFMSSLPKTFKALFDEARLSYDTDLNNKEKMAMFATLLLRERFKSCQGGDDQGVIAKIVSSKMGQVACQQHWLLTKRRFDSNDEWMKDFSRTSKRRHNEDNESPTANSMASL
jgi:hypothetical protein